MGLYYYKARMYSPALGRFLQTDPVGYKDDLNWYAYVGNNPVNFSDPDGLAACTKLDPFGQGAGKSNAITPVYPEAALVPALRIAQAIYNAIGVAGGPEAAGASTGRVDVTIGRSTPNASVDLTRAQFESNLLSNGFSASSKGGAKDVTLYTKGDVQYTVRNEATSTGGPSADFLVGGDLVSKIRLK
ncbi:RHS repeat-associated core domain-containing protein [Caballeronia sp. dw_19]|uniref:RHS repeat-associated core domain-containing protein n=1 Tax=Caballeronia sp. dw_19 TaxID=2719791 RepID=UPI001BD227E6|nr:RHS repeat-associated core domain-containing protein [Caballeronia sp. dw_19]